MSLFGDSQAPKWMTGDQLQQQYSDEGRADAAPFNNAFQAAYQKANNRAYKEKEEQKTIAALTPVAESLRGVKSTAEMMDTISTHPEWMLNPKTAPYLESAAKTWMQADKIKEDALRFNTMNDIRKEQADNAITVAKIRSQNNSAMIKDQKEWDNAYFGLRPTNRNFVDLQEGARENGQLTPVGRALVADMLKAEGKPDIGSLKSKPGETNEEKNLELLKRLKEAGDTEGAGLVENILKARGHLGLPREQGSGKLIGEDAMKEKDLTKRIQAKEKALDETEEQDAKIKIQEDLLNLQSQRHKLYQRNGLKQGATTAPPQQKPVTQAPTQSAPASTNSISIDDFSNWLKSKE